jgi:UDP-N-acetylglucosamine:LPS N-acetylglucosamine transferase
MSRQPPKTGRKPEDNARTARKACCLCLAASPGGHLTELESIAADLESDDKFLVTVRTTHSASVMPQVPKRYIRRIQRNPANFAVNAFQALAILLRDKPTAIVSTGAGDTVPLMLAGSALGIKVIFVETRARVHSASITGRMIRRWTDLTIVYWPSLRRYYPESRVASPLRDAKPVSTALPPHPAILVLTGTGPRGFDRLVEGIDNLVSRARLPPSVFAQIGSSSYIPRHIEYCRFLPHPDLVRTMTASDLIVTHDGAGSIMEALRAGKPVIVVPRSYQKGELLYKSQAELALHLATMGWITLAEDPFHIPEAIETIRKQSPMAASSEGNACGWLINEFLQRAGCGKDSAKRDTLTESDA